MLQRFSGGGLYSECFSVGVFFIFVADVQYNSSETVKDLLLCCGCSHLADSCRNRRLLLTVQTTDNQLVFIMQIQYVNGSNCFLLH